MAFGFLKKLVAMVTGKKSAAKKTAAGTAKKTAAKKTVKKAAEAEE